MESQLPNYPANPIFLSPMDEHNRLLLELSNSAVFQPINPSAPSLVTLRQLLTSRYGGSPDNWKIRPVANAFLVKIPDWVFSDDPYLDEEFWALYHLQVLPWETLDGAEQASQRQRIMVTIHNSPLDVWHPIYFRQATVAMGVMLGFLSNTMTTGNMARARILIACPNTDIIPPYISVHHMNKITHCPVEWEPLQDLDESPTPPDSPLPPPLHNHPNPGQNQQPPQPPNQPNSNLFPPRRIRRLPVPQPDPSQTASPAAASKIQIQTSIIAAVHAGPSPPTLRQESDKMEQTAMYGKIISSDKQLALKVGDFTVLSETYHVTQAFFQIGDFHFETSKCLQKHTQAVLVQPTHNSPLKEPNKVPPQPTHNSPHQLCINTTPKLAHLTPPTQLITTAQAPHKYKKPKSQHTTMNDEEFLAHFANLNTTPGPSTRLQLPAETLDSQDLELCLLLKVISDRPAIENNFSATMLRAWAVNPQTKVTLLTRNIFMAQFFKKEDMNQVFNRGIWTYRGDVVALKRVENAHELIAPTIEHMDIWIQYHRVPPRSVSTDGVLLMARQIGVPTSGVIATTMGGNKFYRIKTRIPIDRKLQGTLHVDHSILGPIVIYLSYEKVNRFCIFCSKLGHEIENCCDKFRLDQLRMDARFRDNLEYTAIPDQQASLWLTNPSMIPLTQPPQNPQNQPDPEPHIINPPRRYTTRPRTPIPQPDGPNTNQIHFAINLNSSTTSRLSDDPTLNPYTWMLFGQNSETQPQSGSKRTESEHRSLAPGLNTRNSEKNEEEQVLPASKKRAVAVPREASPPTQ